MRTPSRASLRLLTPTVLAGALTLAACGSDSKTDSATTTAGGASSTAAARTTAASATTTVAGGGVSADEQAAVVTTYADLVSASYDASVASATALRDKIGAFVAAPSDATLQAAKDQWLAARDDYGPTEAFRFYDGPIDDPEDGPEGRINAWPMDEAYVDYVEGNPNAGIINDTAAYPTITRDVLLASNEKDGETNISTGWHPIEFLLWGQDQSETGPGARPVTDYTTDANAERRATYLTLLADLLVEDLSSVAEQWKPGAAYRTSFEADPTQSLGSIFRGMGALTAGELAGQRMAVAYETKDPEDEHSCFSDNTNADLANNTLGVQRVYLAEFPGISGPSLSTLVAKVAPDLDTKLRAQLTDSTKLTSTLPMPFDQLIQGEDSAPGRTALLAAIQALETQGQTIAEAAGALGITVNLEV